MRNEPYRLFKYRPLDRRTFESLADSTLYGARPEQLNDPLDCQINLTATIEQAVLECNGAKRSALEDFLHNKGGSLTSWQTKARNVGVCSCSMIGPNKLESLPLWNKYADERKGLCLLYEFDEQLIVEPRNGFLAVDKVTYGDNYLVEWLVNDSPDPNDGKFSVELLKRFFTVKSQQWSYEDEGRILRLLSGSFAIPPESLIQVCFGDQTDPINVEKVTELVKRGSSYCSFYEFTQKFSGSEFIVMEL